MYQLSDGYMKNSDALLLSQNKIRQNLHFKNEDFLKSKKF